VEWLGQKKVATGVDRAQLTEAFAAHGIAARPWRLLCVEPAALPACVELAGPRATVTALGARAPAIAGDALAREVTLVGVAGAHPDLVVEAAAMCAKGEIDLAAGTATVADLLRTHVRTSP
jgi:hypothetical protein